MKISSREMAHIWAVFYAGLVSMQYHPRNNVPVNLDELARIADAMVERYRERVFLSDKGGV